MKYDVFGVGNAIVDVVTEVDHDFFEKHSIEKGVMTLVDEKRQLYLMSAINIQKSNLSGGGSAGNTLVALSQFGGKSFFSCLVAHDELGKFFLDDLKYHGVSTSLKYNDCPQGHSGRCLVMTSPDAQRTMNTFLGINSYLSPVHVDVDAICNSTYVYLEGYLVADPQGLEAMKEARKIAIQNNIKIALTFSDPSMVKYFSRQMREIIDTGVDLLFCNEEEAIIFTETGSLHDAREKLKSLAKQFVITLGANGAVVFDGDTFVDIGPYPTNAIDTNGAGDMFAAAFLYGITHGHSYASSGKLASLASSLVVQQWGPRLKKEEVEKILKDFRQS